MEIDKTETINIIHGPYRAEIEKGNYQIYYRGGPEATSGDVNNAKILQELFTEIAKQMGAKVCYMHGEYAPEVFTVGNKAYVIAVFRGGKWWYWDETYDCWRSKLEMGTRYRSEAAAGLASERIHGNSRIHFLEVDL